MRKFFVMIIIVGVLMLVLYGCAGLGYAASAAGAGASEYRFYKLEERLTALEEDI